MSIGTKGIRMPDGAGPMPTVKRRQRASYPTPSINPVIRIALVQPKKVYTILPSVADGVGRSVIRFMPSGIPPFLARKARGHGFQPSGSIK